jgi:hypothetical protein
VAHTILVARSEELGVYAAETLAEINRLVRVAPRADERAIASTCNIVNHLAPNSHFSGRTAPLTYKCCIFLFIQQIYVLNILNMLHTLRFFLFKVPFIS